MIFFTRSVQTKVEERKMKGKKKLNWRQIRYNHHTHIVYEKREHQDKLNDTKNNFFHCRSQQHMRPKGSDNML